MKMQMNSRMLRSDAATTKRQFRRKWKAGLAMAIAASGGILSTARAELPLHDISAGNITVIQNDTGNTSASVTLLLPVSINDFRTRPSANRADYDIQIGSSAIDDFATGVLMSSVAENGRDNGEGTGINYLTSAADSPRTGATAGSYYIPVFNAPPNAGAGAGDEYNVNVSGAWFPYSTWIGGFARNSTGANGGTNDVLTGSPQLVLGQHFIGTASGQSVVDLRSLGIDSRKDGVLLVTGGKNEGNFALSQADTNNGTWKVFVKDNCSTGATSYEQDPVAFVFIPKTNTAVVSGKFLGDGSIDMFSGSSPQFTVSKIATGRYELKVPGRTPNNGVLIISAEGGRSVNSDNIVSYQPNAAGDGWEIQSRDTPSNVLESPGATEPVVSFVYIPGPTPGISVTPNKNLQTTESGGQATFTVSLHTQPSGEVAIGLSSSNPAEGTVSPEILVFNPENWNIPQTVTITGQDDSVADGAVAYKIILFPLDSNYFDIDPDDVSVVNADNENGITVLPTHLTTTEAGGAATFSVRLNTPPSADVSINFFSSNIGEGTISPTGLTFTPGNWNVDQTITVTGVDDLVDDGDVTFTILSSASSSADSSYNGLVAPTVTVTNLNDDVAGVLLNLSSTQVVEGGTTNFTVVLNSKPVGNITIALSSSDTVQGGTMTPASVVFTPANWNIPQTITIHGADDLNLDGNTAYTNFVTVSSGDSKYVALAPIGLPTITLDNEAVLTVSSEEVIYGVGLSPISVAGRANIIDTLVAGYNSATLTVAITNNGSADDRLEIRNVGTAPGQVGVSGNSVTYGGTTIGTFAGGSGATPLVITFNSAANPEAAQAALRSVTFRNINASPSFNRRTATITLTHADGGKTTAKKVVRVGSLRVSDFQEGTDGGYGVYTGQADIELRENAPNTAFPAGGANGIFIDFPDPGVHNAYNALLRFDNIFGNNPGQIPTDAVIVSAELTLNITDTGDGSPLYRMLIPWDENGATWASVGNGIDPDDNKARSSFDSQLGLLDGSGNTGLGLASISVLPDLLAWQNGEANYGWVMPGWSGNFDGTTFSSSEATNSAIRPRLKVLWLPAGTASASFRQGVNGYTNAFDTRIRENAPDAEASKVTGVFVDWAVSGTSDNEQVLLRFDDIIGSGPGRIPSGARIEAAMLDVASTIGNAMGAGGKFHAMLQPWQDTDTWNSLGGGIQANGVKAAITPTTVAGTAERTPLVQGGFHSFELTSDVQAWANGAFANNGWVILPWPNGSDGWAFCTAEVSEERQRPQLRVYYTPGVVTQPIAFLSISRTANSAVLRFSGGVGANCSVQRSATVSGTYTEIGTATIGGDGTATFTDNAPLLNTAFYRIVSQ